MKICHVLWGLTYGGIETMVVNIANEQSALGHEVHLLIINDKIDKPMLKLISPEVKFHCAKRHEGSKSPLSIFNINAILFRINPDITHFHHVKMHKYVLPFLRKKWCTTHHIDCVPQLQPFMAGNPNLFSISNLVRKDILEKTGVESEVVLNGIDARKFRKSEAAYDNRNSFRIVQVGRLDKGQKGQHILIEAAKILKDRDVNFIVDFIGDGISREELQEMICNNKLEERVRLTGAKSPEYIWENLAGYDLLVQPSLYEGFGLTIAEGMAAHIPVLVSDIEVQLEVTDNGRCGYNFRSGDPVDCADKIQAIISDYSRAIDVADKGLERVMDVYDVRVTASNYIEKYRNL